MSKFIGLVSAYAYAKSKGYTGTEEEFAILMAEYTSVTETAVEAVRVATESARSAAAASSDVNRAAATVTQQAAQVHDDAETSSENAATASEAKETAVDKALDSEAYALGTRDGEDVGSSDPAYHNNAKYYAESVSASAQTATQKASDAQAYAQAAAESARTLTIDRTLTQAGQAADSKAVGDRLTDLKEDLNAISEATRTDIKNSTVYNWAIFESTGAVGARSAQRSLIMPCKENTTYTIKNPKGNRLVVGASSVTPYNGYAFTHFSDLTVSVLNASFTTGNEETYLMVNYYYTNDTYTDAEALEALEVYSLSTMAYDKTAREDIKNINSGINHDAVSWINGKKISIIADSISTFDKDGYKTDGYDMYYPHGDVTSVEDMWWHYVVRNTGAIIEKNASYAGSRVTNTDNTKPDFYARTGSSIVGSPDVIFVQLGTNDSTYSVALGGLDTDSDIANMSEAYFSNAYIKGIKSLQANFPNATIVLLILKMKTEYANRIMEIAKLLGVSFVVEQSYTTTQGDHPDKAGMRTIANRVLEYATTALSNSDRTNKRWEIGAVGNEIYSNAVRKSKNLADENTICLLGTALETSGNLGGNGGYTDRCTYAYIPIHGLSVITVAIPSNSDTGTTCRYCWYDKNNIPITLSGQSNPAIGGIKYHIKNATTLAVPSDAYTIAIQLYYEHCILDANDKPMLMVQSGNVYTGYEPFNTSVVTTVKPKDIYVCAKDSEEKYRIGCDYYCNGLNDELTLQDAMDACGNVGTVYLAPGHYHIDSIPLQDDGQYCALQFRTAKNYPNNTHRIRIKGFNQTPMRTDGYSNIEKCAVLVVSADCYASLDDDEAYSVIGVERDYDTNDRVWNGACFDVSGVGIMIPGNQKKIVAFDAWYAFCIMMERCMATAIPTNAMPSVAGVDDCIGIKCTNGSNFGQCSQLTSCAMYGFGQGIAVSGEHYVLTNCKTIYNKYGFTFNWYGDSNAGYCHPNTLVNCCSEMDFNYPYFGYNGQLSSVTLIDFNMEHRTASSALGGELAQERVPGSWRGTINYTIKTYASDGYGTTTGNNVSMPFWKDGHGANVRTRNDAHKQLCTTAERGTYAANEMERVYDTTAGKFYTYVNGSWIAES